MYKLFTYSGGPAQGISLAGPISPTTLSLITNQKLTTAPLSAATVQPSSISAGGGGASLLAVSSTPSAVMPSTGLPPVSTVSGSKLVPPPYKWTGGGIPSTLPASIPITSGGSFIASIDEGINYDLMSPMLTTTAVHENTTVVQAATHTSLIDDERYFQCEPMDATVSPVELTNNPQQQQPNAGDGRGPPTSVGTGNNSAENSNPGTPINK